MTGTQPIRAGAGLAYGLLGMPLAFVALPLYVLLPNYYAREFGMPLATLGAVLLAARLFDAISDPLLGRLSDYLFGRSVRAVLAVGAVSAVVLALGLTSLFFPQVREDDALIAWALVALLITYTAYSQLGIAHQSWGARLGGDELQRGRIVAWREGAALVETPGEVVEALAPLVRDLVRSLRGELAPCPPPAAGRRPRAGRGIRAQTSAESLPVIARSETTKQSRAGLRPWIASLRSQ